MVSEKGLQEIADFMRRDCLEMTTEAGSGHPTSCLSCAEIMSVLFFDEMKYDSGNANNPDNDEFILSKGHAAPILYSALRRARCIKGDLKKLRMLGSKFEGHPMPNSMEWVKVATGSLGQGLSIGVGMALAAKLQGRKFRVYVLCGDSELSEGSNYEALQLASYYNLDNLCLIVDVNRLGQRGQTMLGHDLTSYSQRIESFGWESVLFDGHDVAQLKDSFKVARNAVKPTALLARTLKGKGVSFLEDKEDWHGKALDREQLKRALREIPKTSMPSFRIQRPEKVNIEKLGGHIPRLSKYKIGEEIATRNAYGDALEGMVQSSNKTIVLDAEVSNSTETYKPKEVRPKQFIECFIAEQNMIGIALGLSKKGFDVYASSFSAFLSRAHDQIRMAALSSAKFTVCGSHCGVSIGQDGASQMGLEDISMFRALPDSIVFYPCDAVSAEKITGSANKLKGIKYIRTTRGKTRVIYRNTESFHVGDFKVLKKPHGSKIVLVGSGITVREVLEAHDELMKKGIKTAVVDLYCIKPFHFKKFVSFLGKHGKKIVVAEDHRREGGIAEMLAGVLEDVEIKSLAVDGIPHSGTPDELLRKYGINSTAIFNAAKGLLKKK